MRILWASDAWDDYTEYWCDPQRKRELKRLNVLIEECRRTPYEGKGKPEALRHKLEGWWSRRINGEDRLLYRVSDDEDTLEILACLHHY